MFREKYKNANNYLDSCGARERVKKRLDMTSPHRKNWQQITAVAACFAIVIVGFAAYENGKKNEDIKMEQTPKLARMADVENTEIAIGEPLFDITECEENDLKKIISDGYYTKRTVNGADVFEKTTGYSYECWIKKDGKITKITADSVTDEEKDELILSIIK